MNILNAYDILVLTSRIFLDNQLTILLFEYLRAGGSGV